jgi:hypothetical protein
MPSNNSQRISAVPSVSSSHPPLSSRGWAGIRGGPVRRSLSRSCFLRACLGNSPAYGSRVGVDNGERSRVWQRRRYRGHGSPSRGRISGSLRRCDRRCRCLCTKDGDDTMASPLQHRRQPQVLVRGKFPHRQTNRRGTNLQFCFSKRLALPRIASKPPLLISWFCTTSKSSTSTMTNSFACCGEL